MNKEELVNYINECITEECGIEVFLGLKNKELRKANFLADTQQDTMGNILFQYSLLKTMELII